MVPLRSLWPPVALLVTLPLTAAPDTAPGDSWVTLTTADGLDAWAAPTGDWFVADRVEVDPKDPARLLGHPGAGGLLVNGARGRTNDLRSKQAFGDVEAHAEFLIARGSNSGVKFQGLYEVQIKDSHGVKEPTASDCGGIYPRAELLPRYHHIDKGVPPRTNAAKSAGEWQTLDVTFRAPRFAADAKKTESARFVRVVLNGTLIHDDVEVKYPTGHAWREKEVAAGPLLLQGDHGPVAFRNVRVRPGGGGQRKDPP
jgi:hypothetical protein